MMKKVFIVSSLFLSLGAFADVEVAEPAESDFVIKGLEAIHAKCARAKTKYDNAKDAEASWEVVKNHCLSLPQIPEAKVQAHSHVDAPADLPNKDL